MNILKACNYIIAAYIFYLINSSMVSVNISWDEAKKTATTMIRGY